MKNIDNEFFNSHDTDGFWTEVRLILRTPNEEKEKRVEAFLACFPPYQQSSGSLEQFCRYAVCHLFATAGDSGESAVESMIAHLQQQPHTDPSPCTQEPPSWAL